MQHDHVLKKLTFDLLIRSTAWVGGSVGKIFATILLQFMIPFNLICNITMFWKKWILTYWPHHYGCGGGGMVRSAGTINATMLLHSWFPLIWYATWHCTEKVELWPLDPRVRGGVCGQNIGYHVAAFLILFNLICNMTMLWKSWILANWPQPQGQWAKYLLPCCCLAIAFKLYATWPYSEKIEFWPTDPILRVGGGGSAG